MSRNEDQAMEYNPFLAAQQSVSILRDRFDTIRDLPALGVNMTKDQRILALESLMSACASSLPHIAESLSQGMMAISDHDKRIELLNTNMAKLADGINLLVDDLMGDKKEDSADMATATETRAKIEAAGEAPLIQRIRKISK